MTYLSILQDNYNELILPRSKDCGVDLELDLCADIKAAYLDPEKHTQLPPQPGQQRNRSVCGPARHTRKSDHPVHIDFIRWIDSDPVN